MTHETYQEKIINSQRDLFGSTVSDYTVDFQREQHRRKMHLDEGEDS